MASPIATLAPRIQFIPTAAAIADFNGDGHQDIAATVPGVPPDFGAPYPPGSVYLFQGTGLGGFQDPTEFETGGVLPINIQAAHVNGDAKLDLVIANSGDANGTPEWKDKSIGVLLNVSSASVVTFDSPTVITANTVGPFAVSATDFDLDGKTDIAAVNYGSQGGSPTASVSVYMGNGSGTSFAPGTPASYDTQTFLPGGQYLAAGDFDNNGTPDLIVAHATNVVRILDNTSTAPESTNTALASSLNPSTFGQSVTFTATVTAAAGTASGGTVTFFRNGTQIGSPVNLVNQQAQLSISSLALGTHSITATYSGSSGFGGSTSGPLSQVVNPGAAPTVTINKGGSQADPAKSAPIIFDVQFSQSVTGFDPSDIVFTGSTVGGTLAAGISGSGQNYTVSVTGMTGTGNVVASVKANAAINGAGTGNSASTSTDNIVAFDGVVPGVTINQTIGQPDPVTSGPIFFTVRFTEPVTGFDGTDISFTGSTVGGPLTANVTGSGADYTVEVKGMTGEGNVVVRVPAGSAFDGVGNPSAPSTSTDNTVRFDSIRPSVTINQAVGQPDPTNISSIDFAVKFTETVTGFGPEDVSLLGSLAGGTLVVNVTGSLDTYTVTVTGMTTRGVVIASIPEGGVTDVVGNINFASTSTDNSVEFLNTGTIGFSQAFYYSQETPNTVTIKVTRTGQTDGDVSVDFVITDGTARRGGSANNGLKDYERKVNDVPVYTGTLSWLSGEGGDRTFTIDILQDTLNEGRELINLSLTKPVGSPGLGLVSAALQIDLSDGQGPGSYLDQDGDKYTLKLTGGVGLLNYFRTDPDGNGRGPIELIQLTGTLPDPLRPRANLVITVARANTTSDGMVGLGAIAGPGLRGIFARKANLDLEGINFDGYLGSLLIGHISNGADITTRATTNPLQKTRINALTIGDGTTINVENAISGLSATRIGVGAILAPSIGAIVVRGQVRPTSIIGDMASDITVSGTGAAFGRPALGALIVNGSIPAGADIVAPSVGRVFVRRDLGGDITISGANVDLTRRALGSLRVLGTVAGSDIMVQGNVGAVVVGAFRDSRLYAGYVGPDVADPVGFNMAATIGSFRATGRADGFQNSRVIATHINVVTITNLDSTNPQYFGFYADVRVGSLRVVGPVRFVFDPTISAPQGINEFEVMIV